MLLRIVSRIFWRPCPKTKVAYLHPCSSCTYTRTGTGYSSFISNHSAERYSLILQRGKLLLPERRYTSPRFKLDFQIETPKKKKKERKKKDLFPKNEDLEYEF
jgi:hypothetical protein